MVYKVEGATPYQASFLGECWPKRPKARCYTCGRVCRGPTAWMGAPCVRAVPTDTPCVGGPVPTMAVCQRSGSNNWYQSQVGPVHSQTNLGSQCVRGRLLGIVPHCLVRV
jgi:hypothetical protein